MMLKQIFNNLLSMLLSIILLLVLLFPLMNFRLGVESPIFPAFEVIFIYYCSAYYQVRLFLIFLTGILFDQIYSMPFGTNSLAFILATFALGYLNRWFFIKDYLINFITFFSYCFVIFYFRYLIVSYKVDNFIPISNVVFQYFTTVFTYPLMKIFFDKICTHINCLAQRN